MPGSPVLAARARKAALQRFHGPDHPSVADADRQLRTERLADYITRTVDEAPPLTAEQRDRLALLLRPTTEQRAG